MQEPLPGETERQYHDRMVDLQDAEYLANFRQLSIPPGNKLHLVVECLDSYESMGLFESMIERPDGGFPLIHGCRLLQLSFVPPEGELEQMISSTIKQWRERYAPITPAEIKSEDKPHLVFLSSCQPSQKIIINGFECTVIDKKSMHDVASARMRHAVQLQFDDGKTEWVDCPEEDISVELIK